MGLIRKSLYLASGGIVSPSSKKQRRQVQMIKAMQGASDAEIRRAGGRYDFAGFWGDTTARTQARADPVPPPESADRPSAKGPDPRFTAAEHEAARARGQAAMAKLNAKKR